MIHGHDGTRAMLVVRQMIAPLAVEQIKVVAAREDGEDERDVEHHGAYEVHGQTHDRVEDEQRHHGDDLGHGLPLAEPVGRDDPALVGGHGAQTRDGKFADDDDDDYEDETND